MPVRAAPLVYRVTLSRTNYLIPVDMGRAFHGPALSADDAITVELHMENLRELQVRGVSLTQMSTATPTTYRVIERQSTARLASHKPAATAVKNSAGAISPGRPGNTSGIG
jgi:hypothetical protein